MHITVKLFAILREKVGVGEIRLSLREDATASEALEAFAKQYPQTRSHLTRTAMAVNQEYATLETVLKDGDELALIPPVSGG